MTICSDGFTDSNLMVNFSHYNVIFTLVIQQMVSLFLSWILWKSGSYSESGNDTVEILTQTMSTFTYVHTNGGITGPSCQLTKFNCRGPMSLAQHLANKQGLWRQIFLGHRQQFYLFSFQYCILHFADPHDRVFLFSSKEEDMFLFLSTLSANVLSQMQ